MRFYSGPIVTSITMDVDRGNIAQWNYKKSGDIYQLNYVDASVARVYVPKMNGNSILNKSSEHFKDYRTNLTFVDFQYVPVRSNSLYMSFWGAYYIATVRNINKNVTNMSRCFEWTRTNIDVKLPPKVTDLSGLLTNNYMFDRNLVIPNSVTNMERAFNSCTKLNKSIDIPDSVTQMYGCFLNCTSLNVPINIGKGAINVSQAFSWCNNFASTVTIYSTELKVQNSAFSYTDANKSKTVKIYYEYANGVKTKTYNSIVVNSKYRWHGSYGVTVANMGKAPW